MQVSGFCSLLDKLNAEVGDIRPGPERDAKCLEVVRKYRSQVSSQKEALFWDSMIRSLEAPRKDQ